jgi:hypothetical protein
MSVGRDIRRPSATMRSAPVLGGLEPELLSESRRDVESVAAERAAAYVPEWTGRGPDDAGVAIVKVEATLAQTVHRRLNRLPRRLTLDYLRTAGVRALPGSPALAMGAIEVSEGTAAPLEVPEGSVFAAPTGSVLEADRGCSAVAGALGAIAVLSDGWLALDRLEPPYGLRPFGDHPRPSAEMWLGLDTPVVPAGTLCLAIDLLPPPGRATAESIANQDPDPAALLRWEAMTSGGAVELTVDFDDTRGLGRSGVIGFRVPTLDWPTRLRPGQATGTPLRWLRARLLTATFSPDLRLREIRLNGTTAHAARTIRDEVVQPLDRSTTGSRYRLALVPVVRGSVELEITGASSGLGVAEPTGVWSEMPSLTAAQPDDQVFVLDPATGVLSFGDGLHGRAVPDGYRNVIALRYRTGGSTQGLPIPGDLLPPEISVPDLTGLGLISISTGSDIEGALSLLRRGPAIIRSRRRAVAAADYATAALATPGADVARAHCLPGVDPATTAATCPGSLGVIVVPRAVAGEQPPIPDTVTLQTVADHLARTAGVVGARVVALEPTYRRVAVQCLLVGAVGADLARLVSTARDRIDRWLDPLVGGDGSGWEFGAPLRWHDLVRMLLESVPRLEAISQVSFRVGGRQLPECTDVALAPGELIWPGSHTLGVAATGRGGAG